jgi:TonB family protein
MCVALTALVASLVSIPAAAQTARPGRLPAKIKHVDPVLPGGSGRGVVQVRITVALNGRVTEARVVRSIPALDQAVLAAVRQWEYDPKGMTHPIVATVSVRFGMPAPAPARTARPTAATEARRPGAVAAPASTPANAGVPSPPCSKGSSGGAASESQRQALRDRAVQNATTGRLGFAHQDVDALLKIDACDAEAYFARGLAYFVGNPPAAVKAFSQAIHLDPAAIKHHRGRAWANLVAGDYAAATKDFDQVLQLDPDGAEAFRGRGWAALHAGAVDRAILDFNEVLRRSPANAETWSIRGAAHYLTGRVREARADFRISLTLGRQPNGAIAYNTLILDDWTRHRRLMATLDARIQQNANDVEAWLAVAAVGYHASDPGVHSAPVASDRAVKARPDDVDALMFRALTGHRATAFSDLTEVIRLQPDHSQAYFQRALLQALETRTLPAAIADCRKALQLLSGDPKVGAACQRLELDQRIEEIRKQQEILAEPGRQRAREVMAIMVTFLLFDAFSGPRDPYAANDNFVEALAALDDDAARRRRR